MAWSTFALLVLASLQSIAAFTNAPLALNFRGKRSACASKVHLRMQVSGDEVYELVVLGGGPTGLTAALTAASVGRTVALVDKTPRGQVMFSGPTGLFSKALRDAAKKVKVRTLRDMGLRDASIWKQVQDMTLDILNDSGQANLLAVEGARLPFHRGRATLLPADGTGMSTLVVVEDPDLSNAPTSGGRKMPKVSKLKAKRILVATGSRPYRLPHVPCKAPHTPFPHCLIFTQSHSSIQGLPAQKSSICTLRQPRPARMACFDSAFICELEVMTIVKVVQRSPQ